MKRLMLVVSLLAFTSFAVAAAEDVVSLIPEVNDLNYSYGYQLGIDLGAAGQEVRTQRLYQAINDALNGIEPKISRDEMAAILKSAQEGKQLAADQTALIEDDADRLNYCYGFALGEKLLARQIEYHTDSFLEGVYDANSQRAPRLNEELMAQLLEYGSVNDPAPEEPEQTFRLPGQKFISENSARDGVITLASGLQYKVLKKGEGTQNPKATDSIIANYRATTIEGKEFSSTYPLGIPTPREFKVNKGIPGWTEALLRMHEGDRWELYIPTSLAYKDSGPLAGQTVIIDVELIEIIPGYQ